MGAGGVGVGVVVGGVRCGCSSSNSSGMKLGLQQGLLVGYWGTDGAGVLFVASGKLETWLNVTYKIHAKRGGSTGAPLGQVSL